MRIDGSCLRSGWVVLLLCACIAANAGYGEAAGFRGIDLAAGEGSHPAVWRAIGPRWSTLASWSRFLGVGTKGPAGTLLDTGEGVPTPAEGVLNLYAEPEASGLGANPSIHVYFSDGTSIQAVFEVRGSPGSGETWARTGGSRRMSAGWGRGTADRVGAAAPGGPSGTEDLFIVLRLEERNPWTFFWGVVSVLQMVFLPGFIVLLALGSSRGALRTAVLSFALSLVINHGVAVVLVGLEIFRPFTLRLLLLGECGLLLWFARRNLNQPVAALFAAGPAPEVEEPPGGRRRPFSRSMIEDALLLSAFVMLTAFFCKWIADAGSVFSEWDAVVSWNRWAVEWADNRLPSATYAYPQLLPANWSLSYGLMGNAILQFFAKSIMPLFPLAILCIPLDLFFRSKRIGYLLGVSLAGALLWGTLGKFNFAGYADLPVAFLAAASVYALVLAGDASDKRGFRVHILLGALCSGGCALTKQAGLYIAAIYPLLVFLMPARGGACLDRKEKARLLLVVIGLLAALVLPWYLYKLIQIMAGLDRSNTGFLMITIHKGRSLLGRFQHAVDLLRATPGLLAFWGCILAAMTLSWRDCVWRWIALLVVLPFTLLWALFFSNDIRNIALAVPLAAMAAGIGVEEGMAWIRRRAGSHEGVVLGTDARRDIGRMLCEVGWRSGLRAFGSLRLGVFLVVLPASLVLWGSLFDEDELFERQSHLQQSINSPGMNKALYAYAKAPGFDGKIATFYKIILHLPGLEHLFAYEDFTSVSPFLRTLQDETVGYLLLDDRAAPAVKEIIRDRLNTGEFVLVGRPLSTYLLIRIERGPS